MPDEAYDVVIAGAGPAGATAACLLAKEQYRIALVDRSEFPRAVPCAGWLNARATPLLGQLGVDKDSFSAHECRDITFYKEDFSESASPHFQESPGRLIDRMQFDQALVAAAMGRGVTVIQGCGVVGANLGESGVVVDLADGRRLESGFLLLATGRDSDLLARLRPGSSTASAMRWSAQVEAPLTGKDEPKEPRVAIVLGLERSSSFAMLCVGPGRMSVNITWDGEQDQTVSALINLCRRAHEHNLIPIDLARAATTVKPVRTPASSALDMESHVGKHLLAIGEAGGFVSAVSNEGIYPSMWSAQIAAEVVDKALRSTCSQEELMTFDSLWRIQMAEYLRSPHTDIQFLLPLIFTNQPMADRMGAAFFSGENI